MFDIPSVCSHFTSIAITVFATNVLGDGPSSQPVFIVFSKLLLSENKTSDYQITIHAYTITDNHNRSASGTLYLSSIALYSIVAGSSIVIILCLMLIIIILAGFLKKVYRSRSFQL